MSGSTLDDITAALQFMDDDDLDYLELQIRGRRDDLALERQPREEFEHIVKVIDGWYSSANHGLLELRANLADAGMFIRLEPCSSGYHASLYKFRSNDPSQIVLLDEALSSESEFPEAFSDSDEVTAAAKAIAYNICNNQDGLNCWAWDVALNPDDHTKPRPGGGPWYRVPDALHTPPEEWEQAWVAEVTFDEDEKPITITLPFRSDDYAKVMACAHYNADHAYPASHPAYDVDDIEEDVEWHAATRMTDHNGRFSHWE